MLSTKTRGLVAGPRPQSEQMLPPVLLKAAAGAREGQLLHADQRLSVHAAPRSRAACQPRRAGQCVCSLAAMFLQNLIGKEALELHPIERMVLKVR